MQQNKLFNQTRIRLALWYSGVMGIVLGLLGFGVYRAIANIHIVILNRELESIAKTLHNSLELKLNQPGQIEAVVQRLLPDICVNGSSCFTSLAIKTKKGCQLNNYTSFDPINQPSHHSFSQISEGNYYLRLLDLRGCLIAFAGNPPMLKDFSEQQQWQFVKDSQGNRYHQFSLLLHTYNQQDWGYLQVGRSFKEFDDYLTTVRWVLFLGSPIALGLVGLSSWWLAGLSMQRIYQSYQQIQQFTADVAHELRTPLAAAQATLESVLRIPQLEKEEARDILSTIERQNRRLITLVQDLLLLSRLDHQSVSLHRQSCCLNDIVNDLVEELAAFALAANIELTAIEQVKQRLYVIGDLEQLYRLISNLMINAIQYTPPMGKVQVILQCHHHHALIVIQDTGIGIPLEEQQRIFDRFYRVNSDRSRRTGGAGLGLAIAKAIIDSHQGNIQIHSEKGKGSIFTLRFPLKST